MRATERLEGDAICLVDEHKAVAEMRYSIRVGRSRSLPATSEVL